MYRNLELTLWIGLMLGASYTDLRHRMVPDWLNLCIAACSLLAIGGLIGKSAEKAEAKAEEKK